MNKNLLSSTLHARLGEAVTTNLLTVCGLRHAGTATAVQRRLRTAVVLVSTLFVPIVALAQETKLEDPAVKGAGGVDAGGDGDAAAGTDDDWLPGEIGGSVALTSNYVDRGLTNTSNDPAVQGSLEYAVPTGLGGTQGYIGFWGSNVDLEGDDSTANVEIDAYFGLRGEIGDVGWDVGGTYLYYPGTRSADNFDYWEIPIVLSYQATDQLGFELLNIFAWENQFNTGVANYTSGDIYYDIPVPYVGLQLFAGVGYQYIEDDFNGVDWRAGATVSVKSVDFTVAYTDTDYRARDIGKNQGDAKVVFTVGADF